MNNQVIIIGSGFAGLSAATFIAKSGWKVTVLEKHSTPGGRARRLDAEGFHFDMGPSWYWMPDVFEKYFASFGKNVKDYYSLKRLDPSYRIIWPDGFTDVPADTVKLKQLFEEWEPGSAKRLDKFLKEAEFKYRIGMQRLVYKPGLSIMEFADIQMWKGILRMDVFTSMRKHIRKYFKHERIIQMMEFPVLFLGALPEDTPALYSLMNYADIIGGTWYPEGGIYSVIQAMHDLAVESGVNFHFNEEVTGFSIKNNSIDGVITANNQYNADKVINSADYHFIEQLLPGSFRSYSSRYWKKRQMAPSCLLYYVGISKKLQNIRHHNLFFDTSMERHSREIYTDKSWPDEPLFYVSVSSVTDGNAAPEGHENLFFLIPLAAGLTGDDEQQRERYFNMVVERFEKHIGENIKEYIVYKKTFGPSDFVHEYHSFMGNAYGLANTLLQTAVFKPRCRSSKIKNLYYTGQLTVPGPGMPPSLISGQIVAGVAGSNQNHLS